MQVKGQTHLGDRCQAHYFKNPEDCCEVTLLFQLYLKTVS